MKSFRKYGLDRLNYEPAIFDNGDPKFVYVRQNYSGSHNSSRPIPKNLKYVNFSFDKFFGYEYYGKKNNKFYLYFSNKLSFIILILFFII